MSKKLKSVFFSSSKLRCKFRSLQNSFKVLTAFCVPCLWISNFYPVSIVQFLLLFGLESVSRPWRRKIIFLTRQDTNLPRIQGARPDHVRVESSSCCFPRELVVVYHLQQLSGNSGWKVNGTRLFGSFQWKISGSNGTSEKVVLFFRTECSKRKFVYHLFKPYLWYRFQALAAIFCPNNN